MALKAKKNRVAELEQLMREEANMLEQSQSCLTLSFRTGAYAGSCRSDDEEW